MRHWPSDRMLNAKRKEFPSDLVGREIMKKKKAETCVWVEDREYKGAYRPGCAKWWRLYKIYDRCNCGKKVKVKK